MNTLRLLLTRCLVPTWMETCFSVFKFDSCSTQLHILSEAGGSPEQTIAGISFLCCSLGHCCFQLCVFSLPLLALLQLAFPGVLLGSPEPPGWPFCQDFWVSFNFTAHSSLVICFERTYNLIFWKHLPLAFSPTPPTVHMILGCVALMPWAASLLATFVATPGIFLTTLSVKCIPDPDAAPCSSEGVVYIMLDMCHFCFPSGF